MQFYGVKQSKIRWTVVKIKFIKGQKFKEIKIFANKRSKSWPKKFEKILKNREKNLQFNGVKQSKIRWTVVEIKFIKGKKHLRKLQFWQAKSQKVGLKNLEGYI